MNNTNTGIPLATKANNSKLEDFLKFLESEWCVGFSGKSLLKESKVEIS